jgi:hypothetical protein
LRQVGQRTKSVRIVIQTGHLTHRRHRDSQSQKRLQEIHTDTAEGTWRILKGFPWFSMVFQMQLWHWTRVFMDSIIGTSKHSEPAKERIEWLSISPCLGVLERWLKVIKGASAEATSAFETFGLHGSSGWQSPQFFSREAKVAKRWQVMASSNWSSKMLRTFQSLD